MFATGIAMNATTHGQAVRQRFPNQKENARIAPSYGAGAPVLSNL
jgi:hypothetical protein